jgi:hypothetical protein
MGKFKLIKEYNRSPVLGTIVSNENVHSVHTSNFENIYVSENNRYTIKSPEDYPDNWEKIVKKGYKVLSIVRKDNSAIIYQVNSAIIYQIKDYSNINFNIHSVKRLSDGLVLTIGDFVEFTTSYGWDKESRSNITGFIEQNNRLIISTNTNKLWADLIDSNLELNVRIVPKPLFITEDGVKLFEKDSAYKVTLNYTIRNSRIEKFKVYNSTRFTSSSLIFSTLKIAEEFILMNKPCLSITEVMKSVEDTLEGLEENILLYDLLKNLVKSKQ